MRPTRRTRGMTLTETMMAVSLTATVLITSISVFIFGSYTWIKGSQHVKAEADSALAVQTMDRQLRQAMSVVLDTNGNGVTYELPLQNTDGSYSVPLVWDGITRRIALQGTSLVMAGSDGTAVTLAWSVYSYDPLAPPSTPYQIFTAQSGQVISSLTVMIVTGQMDGEQNLITSRSRQAIYLRNLPQTTS
jgi:Tfp pilus assembly protein PilW